MREIENELRRFIVENFLYGRESSFSDDDSFMRMGIIDSTGMLELVAFLEREYGVAVADRDLIPDNLDSIAFLAQFLRRKLSKPEVSNSKLLKHQVAYSDD